MKGFRHGMFAALILLFGTTTIASAQTLLTGEPQYDVFQLSAEAQADVANDLMSVRLVVQATDPDSAALANKINATMGWAVQELKPFTSIETRTLDYQTRPQYERNGSRIKSWTATQAILLETDDFEKAGKAIQILQERMLVQGMQLKAKPETREKAEEQLINKALDAFKRRAALIETNMGAPGYRVMNLSINTEGGRPHYRQLETMRASESMAVSSAPAIEAGTSTVTVRVSGQIQLE